jgi:hypothetical protein
MSLHALEMPWKWNLEALEQQQEEKGVFQEKEALQERQEAS